MTRGAVWGADPTTAGTGGGRAAVLAAVDHRPAERAGPHAAPRATRFPRHPLRGAGTDPPRRGVRRRRLGASARGIAAGPAVRRDHGSRHMAGGLRRELRLLGIEGPPALLRAPEGNGRAGRLIRTLEEDLPRARTSDAVEELGRAPPESRETRNTARPIAWGRGSARQRGGVRWCA